MQTYSSSSSWDRVRDAFAEQFQPAGDGYIYRRSQKGEAIRVTAEERLKFVGEFDGNIRRARWILYLGLAAGMGGSVLFTLLSHSDVAEGVIIAGVVIALVPYFVFNRWAWNAPVRELAGRTPVARELSPDEVREMKFRRITYSQLAIAAAAAVAFPFFVGQPAHLLTGWNRLWLAVGAALLAFVALQAFRKWRFEQDNPNRTPIAPASDGRTGNSTDDTDRVKSRLWRYVPAGVLFLGILFLAYTRSGKALTQISGFWPLAMAAFAAWALFTVGRGFATGRIQPLARYFYDTYDREAEPKRFWASMAWNATMGGFFLFLTAMMAGLVPTSANEARCYNQQRDVSAQEELAACNALISKADDRNLTYHLGARAFAYEQLNDHAHALADLSEAIRLNPGEAGNYLNRGFIYQEMGDTQHAIPDFTQAIALRPDQPGAYLRRGSAYEHLGELRKAVADFTQVVALDPKRAEGYYYRGEAYADLGDEERAKPDFAMASHLDPRLRSPYS